jgi:hypothetical protein
MTHSQRNGRALRLVSRNLSLLLQSVDVLLTRAKENSFASACLGTYVILESK